MRKGCGKCEACLTVESTKKIVLAELVGINTDLQRNLTVRMWNKVLADNPCENLEKENDKLEHA